MNHGFLTFAIGVSLLSSVMTSSASNTKTFDKKINADISVLRVKSRTAPYFKQPQDKEGEIWSFDWLTELRVDQSKSIAAPEGWVPILPMGKVKGRKEYLPAGWVRVSDVAFPSEFKKVTGCWPIKSMIYVGGDYSVEIEFTVNGNVLVKEWGDEQSRNRRSKLSAQVYIADSVVWISGGRNKTGISIFAGFQRETYKIFPEGIEAVSQVNFERDKLGGCEKIPDVR